MKSKAVTLCSIIADAQDCLPRFFSWGLPRFENIIIVASESIDNTHSMLQTVSENNPNVVLAYREMDNFACQKQYCVDLASTDWKIVIDADEILEDTDLDRLVKIADENDVDLIAFPRYNLQKDSAHFHKGCYPDFQCRLFNSNVSFDKQLIHETMVGETKKVVTKSHIIHWGHIRSEQQLQRKSNVRQQFSDVDEIDGIGLQQSNNWFYERNKAFNNQIEKLPYKTVEWMQRFE